MPNALAQLLLPAECLLCHSLLSFAHSDALVCPVCRHRWRAVRPPWCERCGQPAPHFGPCRLCPDWPAALTTARSAVWLDDSARAAVHALKYGGLPRIADDLAAVMARTLAAPPRDAVLVPIPLGAGRLRTRGYNQSERLASALAARWGTRVAPELLRRARETATQTALTPTARLANVAGAFEMRNGEGGVRNADRSAIRSPHSAFVLIDDVFTTGATLAEAARALERGGARRITALTFGRAIIPDFT
ncbi:MAG TPA: ComF family protein [Gemmatimonadales bacterium]|nr:ComF family protein [Gemmatimonadales bacterium]